MNNEKVVERRGELVDLSKTFLNHNVSLQGLNKIGKWRVVGNDEPTSGICLSRKILIAEQQSDFEITQLINQVRSGNNPDNVSRYIALKIQF